MVSKGETLLAASAVKLYGRLIKGLTINLDDARIELGGNQFLRNQLDAAINAKYTPMLARIYGYSYLGHYTSLSCASIFLVHGNGEGVVNHPDPEIHTVPLFEAMEAGAAHTVSLPSRSWSL